jgi:hypothetical protein
MVRIAFTGAHVDRNGDVFAGHWAPTLLILGFYNKLVKQHGSDFTDTGA